MGEEINFFLYVAFLFIQKILISEINKITRRRIFTGLVGEEEEAFLGVSEGIKAYFCILFFRCLAQFVRSFSFNCHFFFL
jgi:hypothetical protein